MDASQSPSSLEQVFLSPPAPFRGVPFWAWNCKVTAGKIAWQPNRVKLPPLASGEHILEALACGSRFNGFGTLHNANPNYKWYGPEAATGNGTRWAWRAPVCSWKTICSGRGH